MKTSEWASCVLHCLRWLALPFRCPWPATLVYYWWAQPEGKASIGSDIIEGSEFDLRDDFGYDEPEGVLGLRCAVGASVRHLYSIERVQCVGMASGFHNVNAVGDRCPRQPDHNRQRVTPL